MPRKATRYEEEDSAEDHLIPRPQTVAQQYEEFYSIAQPPPQYVQPSVQVPGSAFIGPCPDFANTGAHQLQQPYLHGSVNQVQQVVIVGQQHQQPSVMIAPPRPKSFVWHIVLSCIVFWFCGTICGAIAFFLAVYARRSAESGDVAGARRLGYLSLVLSVVGIVVGVILIVVLCLLLTNQSQQLNHQ